MLIELLLNVAEIYQTNNRLRIFLRSVCFTVFINIDNPTSENRSFPYNLKLGGSCPTGSISITTFFVV